MRDFTGCSKCGPHSGAALLVRRRLLIGSPSAERRPARQSVASPMPHPRPIKNLPRAHPHAVDSFSGFGAWQCAASIVTRYGGKCWSLSLLLTIFTTQFNKEMGSQRRRR
jgi:hypothetical protein